VRVVLALSAEWLTIRRPQSAGYFAELRCPRRSEIRECYEGFKR